MRINLRAVLLTLAAALLVTLGVLCVLTQTEGPGPLLLLTAKVESGAGADIQALEDVHEKQGKLTYELSAERSVTALTARYDVTVVGTNYAYPDVMGRFMRSGAFFTQNAQEAGDRHIVLNEKAAFDLFGGLDVQGNTLSMDKHTYSVVGVIDDGDTENRNVYVPAALLGRQVSTLAYRLNKAGGFTEEHALNALKTAGVTEDRYHILNLDGLAGQIRNKGWMALGITGCMGLILLFGRLNPMLRQKAASLRRASRSLYVGQLLMERTGDAAAMAGLVIWLLLMAGALLWALGGMVTLTLDWNAATLFPRGMAENVYAGLLLKLNLYATFCFAAFTAAVALYAFSLWKGSRKQEQEPYALYD